MTSGTASRPIRVAMIGQKGYPPIHGGIEKHVAELAARLPGLGCDVTIYSRPHYSDAQGPSDLPGVDIVRLPSIPTKHLDAISHTVVSSAHAMSHGADVVHYHALGPGLLSGLPRLFRRQSTVVTVHGLDWQREKWGVVATEVLKRCEYTSLYFPSKTIVVSRALRTYFRDKYATIPTYIPNGTNIPKPKPFAKKCLLKDPAMSDRTDTWLILLKVRIIQKRRSVTLSRQ